MNDATRLLRYVQKHRSWVAVAFITSLCLVLYGLFAPANSSVIPGFDKAGHLLAFFALGVTGRLALLGFSGLLFWPALLVLAAGSEYLQPVLQPGRTFSSFDIGGNVLGIGLALLVSRWVLRERISKRGLGK